MAPDKCLREAHLIAEPGQSPMDSLMPAWEPGQLQEYVQKSWVELLGAAQACTLGWLRSHLVPNSAQVELMLQGLPWWSYSVLPLQGAGVWSLVREVRAFRWLSGKESACQCRGHVFNPWVRKNPWRRKWQPTSVFLPGKSHRERRLVGYSLWGHKSQTRLRN